MAKRKQRTAEFWARGVIASVRSKTTPKDLDDAEREIKKDERRQKKIRQTKQERHLSYATLSEYYQGRLKGAQVTRVVNHEPQTCPTCRRRYALVKKLHEEAQRSHLRKLISGFHPDAELDQLLRRLAKDEV